MAFNVKLWVAAIVILIAIVLGLLTGWWVAASVGGVGGLLAVVDGLGKARKQRATLEAAAEQRHVEAVATEEAKWAVDRAGIAVEAKAEAKSATSTPDAAYADAVRELEIIRGGK